MVRRFTAVRLAGVACGLLIALAIFAPRVLRETGSNTLVIITILGIGVYVSLLTLFPEELPSIYVLSLVTIGISLALLHGLRSSQIPSGGDISFEWFIFQNVLDAGEWTRGEWQGSGYWARFNELTSVTILPAVLHEVTGLNKSIFLVVYRILQAVVPITAYAFFRQFTREKVAFLSAVIIPFQFVYITLIGTNARMSIAYLAFFVFILVFFRLFYNWSDDYHRFKSLSIIMFVSLVFSHYGTALITIGLIISSMVILILLQYRPPLVFTASDIKHYRTTPAHFILISVFIIFIIYGYFTALLLIDITLSLSGIVTGISRLSIESLYSAGEGAPSADTHPLYSISEFLYYTMIAIGGFGLVAYLRRDRPSIPIGVFMVVSYLLLGFSLVVSNFYGGYGIFRVYFQTLIFIGPAMILGVISVARYVQSFDRLNHQQFVPAMIIIFVIFQLFLGTYLFLQLGGIPHAEILNDGEGERYYTTVTKDSEAVAASWVCTRKHGNHSIWADFAGRSVVGQHCAIDVTRGLGYTGPRVPAEERPTEFIYLRCQNTQAGTLYSRFGEPFVDIQAVSHHLDGSPLIYDNGCASVLGRR